MPPPAEPAQAQPQPQAPAPAPAPANPAGPPPPLARPVRREPPHSPPPVAGPSSARGRGNDNASQQRGAPTQSTEPIPSNGSTPINGTASSYFAGSRAAPIPSSANTLVEERLFSPGRSAAPVEIDDVDDEPADLHPQPEHEASSDYDFGDDGLDEAFFDQVDQLERRDMEARTTGWTDIVSAHRPRDGQSGSARQQPVPVPSDVIDIDDEEEDKENVAVSKRSVRSRLEQTIEVDEDDDVIDLSEEVIDISD
ncbi:hypothetical protein BV25DRAFT_162914 [Artomyces pyxidatus]|uniref:Uncharacterized protein n=1 Tax=Artomyces pyxidatus TaxID=48021 RepID=A0ACB8T9W2_9AGAM|nr:hypothetical protein BV25DRAFT_162914 [Artomyces pyxidatus]